MTNASYPYASYSDAELASLLETCKADIQAPLSPAAPAMRQAVLIEAEIKFRSQLSAAEKLAEAHYDHDRDEHNEPVTWAVAIDAMGADLLVLDVPAELVLRHAARMCQMVGIEAAATDAAPSYTQRSFDKKAAEINRLY